MQTLNAWLVLSYALSAFGIAAAVFGLAWWLHRCVGGGWKWWGYGVLVFVVFQGVLRVPWVMALPRFDPVRTWLQTPAGPWVWIAVLSVTAGLFEEGGRWIGYRKLFAEQDRRWNHALMFGAGHGGIEALAVAVLQGIALLNYVLLKVLDPKLLRLQPKQVAEALKPFASLGGWEPLLGLWERLCALPVHLALSVLVLQTFLRRDGRWWVFAVAAHALTNLAAIGVMIPLRRAGHPLAAMIAPEIVVTFFAALGIGAIWWLRDRPTSPAAT